MTKVFILTAGEYSDYHIHSVWTEDKEEDAKREALLNNLEIEEHEVNQAFEDSHPGLLPFEVTVNSDGWIAAVMLQDSLLKLIPEVTARPADLALFEHIRSSKVLYKDNFSRWREHYEYGESHYVFLIYLNCCYWIQAEETKETINRPSEHGGISTTIVRRKQRWEETARLAVWAKDEQHALKIGSEFRAQWLAGSIAYRFVTKAEDCKCPKR